MQIFYLRWEPGSRKDIAGANVSEWVLGGGEGVQGWMIGGGVEKPLVA